MADQAELVFVRNYIKALASTPVKYPNDYQQPPQNSLKKVPILQVPLPPVPERKAESSTPAATSLNITVKSLKPTASFSLSVQSTDTISDIKTQLASQPRAPPADVQRLLLKGKALADTKLLKEYSIKDGDTVNLVVKPGFGWDPSSSNPTSPPTLAPSAAMQAPSQKFPSASTDDIPKLSTGGHRHGRTPSIVLSPSPSQVSLDPDEKIADINLTLDTSSIPTASSSPGTKSTYQTSLAEPGFWDRLYSFLRTEFTNDGDALLAFEDFLRAAKGNLTANEIAKIRDHVGVVGMAGT